MDINFNRFPGGKMKALTMSYDDGVRQDIRLVGIFNKYGIKGTFHLNSGLFGSETAGYLLSKKEIKSVYSGHEISAHGFTHQALSATPNERIISEIMRDREQLEDITGAPVRGMSYPYGSVDDNVVSMLSMMGIEYCRTVHSTGSFSMPRNFLRWDATCHHNDRLMELGNTFLAEKPRLYPLLMYVWGHSYEFDNNDNWELIDKFCETMGGHHDDIWYATNIEITDYTNAVHALKFTARQDAVFNQSCLDVWISVNNTPVEIKGGCIVRF